MVKKLAYEKKNDPVPRNFPKLKKPNEKSTFLTSPINFL